MTPGAHLNALELEIIKYYSFFFILSLTHLGHIPRVPPMMAPLCSGAFIIAPIIITSCLLLQWERKYKIFLENIRRFWKIIKRGKEFIKSELRSLIWEGKRGKKWNKNGSVSYLMMRKNIRIKTEEREEKRHGKIKTRKKREEIKQIALSMNLA